MYTHRDIHTHRFFKNSNRKIFRPPFLFYQVKTNLNKYIPTYCSLNHFLRLLSCLDSFQTILIFVPKEKLPGSKDPSQPGICFRKGNAILNNLKAPLRQPHMVRNFRLPQPLETPGLLTITGRCEDHKMLQERLQARDFLLCPSRQQINFMYEFIIQKKNGFVFLRRNTET